MLSVAALSKYNIGEEPKLHNLSNYGNNSVDILSPGQEIPVLVLYNLGVIAGCISFATAITTGLAAILASCDNNTNAHKIREAIIQGANQYKRLFDLVKDGKVLNVYKSVQEFCFYKAVHNRYESYLREDGIIVI